MVDEVTPKLGLTKPDVGASDDTWGNKLNANMDILDAASGSAAWNSITGKPATFPPDAHTHAYSTLTGIPASFPPSAHNHAQAEVTNLVADLAARVLKAGDTMTGHLSLPITPAADNAVRRDYVDTSVANRVSKQGDTMAGHLSLPTAPAAANAVRKDYVDAAVAAVGSFPASTQMLFFQGAAPTGWTKMTIWDNIAIRITNGTSGGGAVVGTSPFTTVFGKTATDNFTITSSYMGVAAVGINTSGKASALGSALPGQNPWGKDSAYETVGLHTTGANNNEGVLVGGVAHSHTMDMRLMYVDAIVATKN